MHIMKRSLILLSIICWCAIAIGQQQFMTGTSTVSIEPGKSVVSAALAGYGIPREGRFSLTWEKIDQTVKLKSITSFKDGFLAIDNQDRLLSGTISGKSVTWETLGKANKTVDVTVADKQIYAISNKGQLLRIDLKDDKLSFKKIKQQYSFTSLTSLNKKLYAHTKDGNLLEGKIKNHSVEWKKIGSAKAIISLASDDKMLYALNSGDTIWSIKPSLNKKAWTVIGRNNGITFNEKLQKIAVVNNVIYALNNEQHLLKGNHKSNGDLAVNTLAIKSSNQTVVIAGVDVCGFDRSFIQSIKDHFYKTRRLPHAAILINASHTHFAPVTQSWATWGEFYHVPDTNYLNNVVKKSIIKSIEEALDNMSSSDMFFGRGTTIIGANRRSSSTVTRPYDNTLDVIKISGADNTIKSVLFSAGCHPVFQNQGAESYTLGANYPVVARQYIHKHANTAHSVFLQGCGGDINPRESNYHTTGNTLGAEVANVLGAPLQKLQSQISFYIDTVNIPVEPWPVDKIQEFKALNSTKNTVEAEKNVRWSDLMLERYRKNEVQKYLPVYIQTLNIGNWKLVGLSREVVTDYGLAIRQLWPDKIVTVAGYCNDVSSYLPAEWHIKAGVYEGYESFFWYGQSGLPPKDILDRVVGAIKQNNR